MDTNMGKTAMKQHSYVPSKSLIPPSAQHQHLMSMYNLPTQDEPRPMCGQALISKILLKKSERKRQNHIPLEQQGLFSMELAADTESEGGSSSAMIPKFIMQISPDELKQIKKDKEKASSSKKKKKQQLQQHQQQLEDSPSSRTSLTTEDLAQLSPYSPPNFADSGSHDNNNSYSPPSLRVRVQEVNSEIGQRSLGDNLSSQDSASDDSLVSNMKVVLEEQQKALKEMALQNEQFKKALMSYNTELHALREERLEQKIRMAQLVLQNETFETQSIVLRSEINSLKSMLDEKQDEELRQRFESLLDEDSVYDEELEYKVLGATSGDSFEDEILKVSPNETAKNTDRHKQKDIPTYNVSNPLQQQQSFAQFNRTEAHCGKTNGEQQSHYSPNPTARNTNRHKQKDPPTLNVSDQLQQRPPFAQFDRSDVISSSQMNCEQRSDEQNFFNDPSSSNTSLGQEQDLFEKARRAMNRVVAEESPRCALAPRAVEENLQRQPSLGAQESIEVSIDDDHDGTVFTEITTFSGSSKKTVNAFRDRLGQIKKKRQERSSLSSLFEAEIGKTYEA